MFSRRSFLRKVAAVVAAAALAPEIAFGALNVTKRVVRNALNLPELLAQCYAIKRQREALDASDKIDFWCSREQLNEILNKCPEMVAEPSTWDEWANYQPSVTGIYEQMKKCRLT